MHKGDLKEYDMPLGNQPDWTFPLYTIWVGDAYHYMFGESSAGRDITGIPDYADKAGAAEQIEHDGLKAEVVEVDDEPSVRKIARTRPEPWVLYFESDDEAEMQAVNMF